MKWLTGAIIHAYKTERSADENYARQGPHAISKVRENHNTEFLFMAMIAQIGKK